MIKHTVIALAAALLSAAPAYAQDDPEPPENQAAAQTTLLPESLNLSVVEGSNIPTDCQFPETISDTARFELACVTMPRFSSSLVGAAYLGQLGQLGWRQGDYIDGGMTAVRTDESNCERVLNMFPADFPPGETASPTVVIWFVLERAPRCAS